MGNKTNTPAEGINIADVEARIAEMLAKAEEAKAEAEKILAEAQAQTKKPDDGISEERKAKRAEQEAYMNELVPIKLFKDGGKYKDDVFVGVNGETVAVQRGEKVMIKRKFAEILEQSEAQDTATSKLIEKRTAEFDKVRSNL